MPPSKSTSTCVQCRARKVRCSGAPPCCSNCDRLEFSCSFAEPSGHGDLMPLPRLEKRRRPLACIPCRATKSRCTGETPACEPCRVRTRECVYPNAKRRSSHSGTDLSSSSTVGEWSLQGDRQTPRRVRLQASSSSSSLSRPPEQQPGRIIAASPPPPPSTSVPLQAMGFSTREMDNTALPPTAFPTESNSVYSVPLLPRDARSVGTTNESWQSSASNMAVDSPSPSYPLPTTHERLQMVNDFFRHIYALPGSAFLSEVSVTKRCLDGTIDEALLLAICGFTTSILRYPKYYPAHATSWVQRAEDLVWQTIENPSVFKTQALLLAVLHRIETGNFKRGYMLLSIVSRSASALRLQYERLDLDHLSQEVRRRLTWSIMLVDSYFSVGLPESGVCQPDLIYLKMPCPEENFHANEMELVPASLDGVSEGGLLQIYVRLSIIRRDVMRLKRQLSVQSNAMPQLTVLAEEMVRSLKLAEPSPYSAGELQRYALSRWFMRYIAVHIAWHQSHCDIYRLFVSGYQEAAPDAIIRECEPDYVTRATDRCLHHARMIVNIIKDVRNLRQQVIAPTRDICIGGYHASRLLLFFSTSDIVLQDQSVPEAEAISLAQGTLEVLRSLFSSSAVLGKTVKDLEHIIKMHISGTPGQPRDSSDEEQQTVRSRRPRFAMNIQRRTSLGIHSALRHARFHDEDEDVGETGAAATQVAESAQAFNLSLNRGYKTPLDSRHGELADHSPRSESGVAGAVDQLGGGGPSLEFLDLSAWDLNLWPTWAWQTDFSPGSSHDCV